MLASVGTTVPGKWMMRARLPTAARIDVTSSKNVGRSGPTALITLSERVAPCSTHSCAKSSISIARIRYSPFPPIREYGQATQQPRDVVEKDALATEKDSWADSCP